MGRRGSETRGLLACVEGEDPLAESVIKPAAAAIKPRRFGAKPWRAHEDSATGPEHVSHTRGGGGVALTPRIALTPFSTPVASSRYAGGPTVRYASEAIGPYR